MKKLVLLLTLTATVQAQDPLIRVEQQDRSHSVWITDMVHNNIDFSFFGFAERANLEAIFCMMGEDDSRASTTLISELQLAWIDSAGPNHLGLRAEKCKKKGVIGTLHFHPGGGSCGLSADDINAAHFHPWPVMAVICQETAGGPPKLIVVHRKKFDNDWKELREGKLVSVSKDTGTVVITYRYRGLETSKGRP